MTTMEIIGIVCLWSSFPIAFMAFGAWIESENPDVGDVFERGVRSFLGCIVLFIVGCIFSPKNKTLTHEELLKQSIKDVKVWTEVCDIEYKQDIILSGETIGAIRDKYEDE